MTARVALFLVLLLGCGSDGAGTREIQGDTSGDGQTAFDGEIVDSADAGAPDSPDRDAAGLLDDVDDAVAQDVGLQADAPADLDSGSDPLPDSGAGTQVAACTVEPMDDLYPGFLPPNPYAPFPEASECVAQRHDVIIVLGCPTQDDGDPARCQRERADMAVALAAAGYSSRFITTGGAVANAYVEAETLRSLLLERGVGLTQIWTEPLAEHTDENLYFSTRIMEAEAWASAIVVSDDPGHLMMTAVCDSNCCVELGRLTLVELEAGGSTLKVGHYVRYPWAEPVSAAECWQIELVSKVMCLNQSSRRACASDFQLDD